MKLKTALLAAGAVALAAPALAQTSSTIPYTRHIKPDGSEEIVLTQPKAPVAAESQVGEEKIGQSTSTAAPAQTDWWKLDVDICTKDGT
jgi:hypothetical protein